MNVTIQLVLPLVLAAPDEGVRPPSALEARVLEAAGVAHVAPSEEVGAGLFAGPHGVELEWSRPAGSQAVFLPFPGGRGRLEATLPVAPSLYAEYAPWRADLAEPPLAFHPATLTFVQEGATATARARVAALPSDPLRLEPVVVTEASAGCSMSPQFELPLELTAETPPLEFLWDLHSPARLDGLSLSLRSDGERLGRVPMSLEVAVRPVVATPSVVEFAEDEDDTRVVEVTSELDADFEVLGLICPPCCEAVEYERLGFLTRVQLRETAVARLQHACTSIVVNVRVGEDPRPFAAFVRLHHASPVVDASGRRVVRGAFLSGERVVVAAAEGGAPVLLYPDRFPERCAALLAGELRELGALEVDTEADELDRAVEAPGGPVRVTGTVVSPSYVYALSQTWSELQRE